MVYKLSSGMLCVGCFLLRQRTNMGCFLARVLKSVWHCLGIPCVPFPTADQIQGGWEGPRKFDTSPPYVRTASSNRSALAADAPAVL